jgi:hypothetical protein
MTGCSACDSGLLPGTSGGGRKNRRNHRMRGGAHTSLSPASLTGDSFDRNGPALSKAAHNLYVNQNYQLASIKNINAMAGGKGKSKTAKKYRSKSKSKQQRGGILELGALMHEAAVPITLLAAQQKYFKRRGTKGYKGRKSRKFRGSKRRR